MGVRHVRRRILPPLRKIAGMGHTIRLADIHAALRKLDGDVEIG